MNINIVIIMQAKWTNNKTFLMIQKIFGFHFNFRKIRMHPFLLAYPGDICSVSKLSEFT